MTKVAESPLAGVRTFPPLIAPESDPTGRSAHEGGAKLDAGKLMGSLLIDFARALTEVAKVSTMGAQKYSRGGWQTVPNGIERYDDAKWRHILKAPIEGKFDIDSALAGYPNIRHKAQEAWNVLASLEIELRQEAEQQGTQYIPHGVDPRSIAAVSPGSPIRVTMDPGGSQRVPR